EPNDPSARPKAEREIDRALGRLRDDMSRAVKKLADADAPLAGAALDRLALALVDQRLRERLVAAAAEPSRLRAVAKDYARAPHRLGEEDPEGIAEIEELCALVGATADASSQIGPGRIWIADRIGAFVAVAAVARGASALVASSA